VRKAVHVIVRGRVQGVGYRAWTEMRATERGLDGWVRNRHDGTVEAMFAGAADVVDAMVAECRQGPPSARGIAVEVMGEGVSADRGFSVKPTV
jgi:acylphosphatase